MGDESRATKHAPRGTWRLAIAAVALLAACASGPGAVDGPFVEPRELHEAGELRLAPAEVVALEAPPAAGPRAGRDVRALAPVDDGGLEALVEDRGGWDLVRWHAARGTTSQGRIESPPGASGRLAFDRLAGGAWLLASGGVRPGEPTRVWRLVAGAPAVELPLAPLGRVLDACGLDDGGYALLLEAQGPAGAARRFWLTAHDADGRERWRAGTDRGDALALHTPIGLAARPDGAVAVLDLTRETVQWFERDGRCERVVDLRDATGSAPDYLTGLAPGPTGGLLVSQIAPGHPVPRPDGEPRAARERFGEPLVWLDAGGEQVARLVPRLVHGAPTAALAQRAVGTTDGRIATFEGAAVYELDAAGRATALFGEETRPERLDDPRAAVFARDGGVLVLDGRSGAVHRFGPDGRRGALYRPEHGDFDSVDLVELEVRADGAPAVRTSVTRSPWLEFAAGGERLARHDDGFPLAHDGYGGEWRRSGVGLVRARGAAVEPVALRPDGGRVRTAVHATADAEGALALVDMAPRELENCPCFLPVDSALDDGDPATYVALWDRRGSPEASFRLEGDLSGHRIERAGGWLLIAAEGRRARLVRIADGATFDVLALPVTGAAELADPRVRLGLAPDGRSLWALELDGRRITRHALPAPADAALAPGSPSRDAASARAPGGAAAR